METKKFKYHLWVTYKKLDSEGTDEVKIEFETESQDPAVVKKARIKAHREQLDWRFDTTRWFLFDENSQLIDQKTIECC